MDMPQSLTTFMETLNKAMPGAWDAAIRQVYIHGVLWLVAATISALIALSAYKEVVVCRAKKDKKSEDEGWEIFITIVTIFTLLSTIVCAIYGGMHLLNPKYQAIQLLMP